MSEQSIPLVAYVEDDDVIRSNFSELFQSDGYRVLSIATYEMACIQLIEMAPDLAVIDIELGDKAEGGLELCAMFRERFPDRPVIILTSHDHVDLQERGWRLGADDYVPKSTSIQMILVRIRALLNRYRSMKSYLASAGFTDSQPGYRGINHLFVDKSRCSIQWKRQTLNLSLTQYWILKCLVDKDGSVATHDDLQKAAEIVVEPNTIAAHIKNIRLEFKMIDQGFDRIKTERGRGYRWCL